MKAKAVAIVLLAACTLKVPVFAGVNDSSEAALRAVMAERREASMKGQSDKISASLAEEYRQTDISGYVQDKTTWLNEYFNPLAELIRAGKFNWEVFDQKDLQLQVFKDFAVVRGKLEAKGKGASFSTQQHHWVVDPMASFTGTLCFTHVYIRRKGRWLLIALHNAVPIGPAHPSSR